MPKNKLCTYLLSQFSAKKSVIYGLFLFCSSFDVSGQSYIGFTSENYSGIHGVLANPAMVVDSRYKVDVNLGSFSIYGGSDGIGVDVLRLATDETYNLRRDAEYTPKDNNNVYGHLDVLGPSFMFNIGSRYAIGLTTRARGFANINNINGELFRNAWKKFDQSEDFSLEEGDFNITVHSWTEFGITLGAVLADQGKHFLKAGATLKYLRGVGAGTIDGLDINANYRNNGAATNTLTSTGEITYILSEGLYIEEQIDYSKSPSTIGADFGFVYEWRPENERYYKESEHEDKDGNPKRTPMADKNKYRFRAGVSITDFGTTLGYNSSTLRTYNTENTVDVSELTRGGIENRLDDLYLDTAVRENDLKVFIPTAVHINLDWKVKKKLYLNVNTDLSLRNAEKIRANRSMSSFSVTPRYESKWLSFYVPVSLRQQGDFAFGMGFRLGPVFVGSGSVFSNLINKSSKTTDVYAGLKIPLFHRSTGDIGPPVEDEEERDSDGDGVIDSKDECPDLPGLPRDKGCPIGPDSDGDGVPDDKDECPDNAGIISLGGCPDADGDGVADIDDVCPELAGVAGRDGCPEDIDKVVPSINNFANIILFKHAKSSFQEATFSTLNSIVEILKEYPKSKFMIEGHTDNSGRDKTNMRLSNDRAEAVRDYLVANGIDISRLGTIGFGETKPLSTNETETGRAINRRVVVKLLSTE